MKDTSHDPLPELGCATVLRASGEDPLPALVDRCEELGARVLRDVVLGMPGDRMPLSAKPGDFWFHTDAVFLPEPPRWVVIQVLEAEGGGDLHVLDATMLMPLMPPGDVLFGDEGTRHRCPITDQRDGTPYLRYRRDYMSPVPDGADVDAAHMLIESQAALHARRVEPPLARLDCVILDNWCLLHRRQPFVGRRVIRRLWLGPL